MKKAVLILSLVLAIPASASSLRCENDARELPKNSTLFKAVDRTATIAKLNSRYVRKVGHIFNAVTIQDCTHSRASFQGVAIHFKMRADVHGSTLITLNCLSKQKRFRTADGAWGRWLSSATRCAFPRSPSLSLGPIDDSGTPSDNGGTYSPDDTYDPDYNRRVPNYGNYENPDVPGYSNDDSHVPSDNGSEYGSTPGYSGDEWH